MTRTALWRFFCENTPSIRAASFVALYPLAVAVVTLLQGHAHLALTDVAATPAAVDGGKLWLLFTSALVAEGNLALSLLGVLTLSAAVLLVCGWRVLWWAGVIGHVGAALGTYAALALVAHVHQEQAAPMLHALDYGVSAFVAGDLGALMIGAWYRRAEWPLTRLWRSLIAASVGSTVLMTLHVLDPFWFEHIPAFLIGGGVAFALRERTPAARVLYASAEL